MPDNGFHPFGGRLSKHFRSDMSPDTPYLSYYDIRLMREDVETLKDDWLTDNCISFWEEYLEREFLTQHQTANIVLLRPSMSFMLMQTPDPLTLKEALPDFRRITHIFLPINDCRNPSIAEGGSHWSLLLVSVNDRVSFHYDSLNPSNVQEANSVSLKLGHLLNKNLQFINLNDTPQQKNSSDCGVFVCVIMRHLLLKKLLRANSKEKISMTMSDKRVEAGQGRKEMLKIIEERRKEGERRRSYVLTSSRRSDDLRAPLHPYPHTRSPLYGCELLTLSSVGQMIVGEVQVHTKTHLGVLHESTKTLEFYAS